MQKRRACNKASQAKIREMVEAAIAAKQKPNAKNIAALLNIDEKAVASFVAFYTKPVKDQQAELAKKRALMLAKEKAAAEAEAAFLKEAEKAEADKSGNKDKE